MGDVFQQIPSHERASVSRPAKTYLHKICVDMGCSLEELLGEMDDREGWKERERERESQEKSVLSA